jgi:hypothetical protein
VNGQLLPTLSGVTVTPTPQTPQAPKAAVGWNVYVSTTDADFALQNAVPLQLGTGWQLPIQGLVAGAPPSGGQQPDFYVALTRRILRG